MTTLLRSLIRVAVYTTARRLPFRVVVVLGALAVLALVTVSGARAATTVVYDSTAGAGGVANFDVTSIAGGGVTLTGVLSGAGEIAATQVSVGIRFNNDSGANYDQQVVTGSATTASAVEGIAQTSAQVGVIPAANAPAGAASTTVFQIHDYDGTTLQKSLTAEGGSKTANATGGVSSRKFMGFWRSTAAITRVTLVTGVGDFAEGTRLTIYRVSTSDGPSAWADVTGKPDFAAGYCDADGSETDPDCANGGFDPGDYYTASEVDGIAELASDTCGGPALPPCDVQLSADDKEAAQGAWWGTWAIVGLLFAVILAPRWFSAFRVTHGA